MQLIIAEKPSVAREIAYVLGVKEKRDGYISGSGYAITWALGHLVTLAMPEDYGVRGFQREALPILPDPFRLTVRKVKKDKGYVTDIRSAKQLGIISELFSKCQSIIVATDAGREGELIFRYIYEYLNCKLPFERLWISSLTERAIREGFNRLQPGNNFDGLYRAGKARSRADWLVGINASQALTIAAGSGIYSLGRVQTPTLMLICRRYSENKTFQSQKYWQIELALRKEFVDFKSLSVGKWDDKSVAEDIKKEIEKNGKTTVVSAEIKNVIEQPPLLFDLTGLQKECNKKLGLSAEETLNIAQDLYEKQYITYPRTGSKYIPEDMWEEIPKLVRALDGRQHLKESLKKIKWGSFNQRIINDLKVTDHHGMLTTEKVPLELSGRENAVYDMIALRLLEAISQACQKEVTELKLETEGHAFISRGIKIKEAGWRGIKGSFQEDGEEPITPLPDFSEGESLKIKASEMLEKQTKAPALYTEASLLTAMEIAGKRIEEEAQRKILQEIGIGTPATRAAIIETLFDRNYIQRVKKSLIPTEKGMEVYELVKDKQIADVGMTAEWEIALHKIEHSEIDVDGFQKEMEDYATAVTTELIQAKLIKKNESGLTCPKCNNQQIIIREKIAKCPDETDCGWKQFRNVCGITLRIEDIKDLVEKRSTGLLKGMKSKSGKNFNARIVLDEKAATHFEF